MADPDRRTPGPRIDWGIGQYEATALELEPVARRVIEMAEIGPGEPALDVACGTGNAALLAAKAGASATGLDRSELAGQRRRGSGRRRERPRPLGDRGPRAAAVR